MAQPVYDEKIVSQFMAVSRPNVSDALDRLRIAGAPQGILPLFPTQKIVGHAATLKLVPAGEAPESAVNGTLAAIVTGGRGTVLEIDGSSSAGVNSFGGIAGATSEHHGLVDEAIHLRSSSVRARCLGVSDDPRNPYRTA